jgi:oligosaccharide repeat unit polymerase
MFAYLFTMQADRRRLAFGAHFSAKAKLNWNWHAIAVVATFVIAIPAFMVAAYLTTRIGAVGLDAYFRNRIYYRSDLGAIAVLTKTMPVYAALLVMAVRSCAGRRRVLWSVALALSTIVWAAYSAATGIRFEIFSWLAAAIITALFVAGPEVGRVVRRLVVPTLVLGVLLSLAGEARRAFVSGDTGETFSRSLLRGVNGAFGNHENVVWLVESKPELTHGSNLASMVTALVPRAIWPDKPTGGGPILTNIIYPDSYYVGGWGVSSLTTGLLTEFYMAFGWLGVLIGSLIIGYLLYIVRRAFLAGQNRMIVSISLIATVYIAIFSQFSELSQMSLQVILSITVLVACYMLAVGPHARAPTVSGRRVS